MTNTNPTIAPLYGTSSANPPEKRGPRPEAAHLSKLTGPAHLCPSEAVKQKPTIARLRDACDALHIYGTRRLVAYELLSYFSPGGTVFTQVLTALAHCLPRREIPQRGRRNGRTLWAVQTRSIENPALHGGSARKELERYRFDIWRGTRLGLGGDLLRITDLPGKIGRGKTVSVRQRSDHRCTGSGSPHGWYRRRRK